MLPANRAFRVRLKAGVLAGHIAKRCISQNRFAALADISSGHMSQLLRGERDPSPGVRKRILETAKLSFEDLFVVEFHGCNADGESATGAAGVASEGGADLG
jgi:transcriptional regulator with XRE-family HTH domain